MLAFARNRVSQTTRAGDKLEQFGSAAPLAGDHDGSDVEPIVSRMESVGKRNMTSHDSIEELRRLLEARLQEWRLRENQPEPPPKPVVTIDSRARKRRRIHRRKALCRARLPPLQLGTGRMDRQTRT